MVENTVDPTTGMVTVRALMPNGDQLLWPGTLVNVQTTVRTEDAVVVPSSAVQVSQQGPFVFVIRDGRAIVTPVKVMRLLGVETVLESGAFSGTVLAVSAVFLGSLYRWPAFDIKGSEVLTHKPSVAAYRAPVAPHPPPASTPQRQFAPLWLFALPKRYHSRPKRALANVSLKPWTTPVTESMMMFWFVVEPTDRPWAGTLNRVNE